MDFKLYEVGGYAAAINSLRMSTGKFYSWEKARHIQDLVYVVTDSQGFIGNQHDYNRRLETLDNRLDNPKITGDYKKDLAEFERLLQLTFNNAMKDFKHHTLMKYIDITFFTEGLHRGAQDDLDAHAIAFNNRITRYSTRLAEIDGNTLSEWYQDKLIPIYDAIQLVNKRVDAAGITDYQERLEEGVDLPDEIEVEGDVFKLTPFGYVLERYAQVPAKNGLAKDVQRGGMLIGQAGHSLWKSDIFNLRYVYSMRSKLTKASPELKDGMELLADQIETKLPVFGPYFRKVYTDSKAWEHVSKVKTITAEEYQLFQQLKKQTSTN